MWLAEDAPNLPADFVPDDEEHAAAIAARVLYRGPSRMLAVTALVEDLKVTAEYPHVRSNGDARLYKTAAHAVALGITDTASIKWRVWRYREV